MSRLKNAHALLIGIGNDLPGTVRDAIAINNILEDERLAGYNPENIILVTEKEATREGILKAFDTLIERTDENSTVMLYYSGHGGLYEPWNQYYLVPNNFDSVAYETTWVKAEELKEKLQSIKSRKLIFFLDCCHAAGMTKSGPQIGVEGAPKSLDRADGLAQKIDDGKGMCIISSCREDQLSYIMEGDSNSLFTMCLIEVLKGKHKTQFEEPYVRIYEVCQYIFKKVPERNPNQRPYANLQIYDDFVLSYIPENLRTEQVAEIEENVAERDKAPTEEVVTTFRETDGANNVILFVHGFFGEGAKTFGRIPELLVADNELAGWDMLPLGYSEYVNPKLGKHIWASIEDIERIADYLCTSIKHRFGHYERIALVAHSLGGLVVQKALLDLSPEHRNRISHVALFASPNNGIESENLSDLWQNRLMDLSSKAPFISALRERWDIAFKEGYPFKLKVVTATHDEYIDPKSSQAHFSKDVLATVAGNHFDIVQPESENNDSYCLIRDLLTDNQFFNRYTSETDINLTLGSYASVVQQLMPRVDELDSRGFEKLIFALEGLDRGEEALGLLKKHLDDDCDLNILGLLAGRYKRKYLLSLQQTDGEESLRYYTMLYDRSVMDKRPKMLYYAAINLAFLHLVLHRNHGEMTRFAEEAREQAEQDVFENLWKLATLAEANLYLGKLDEAQNLYEKAAAKAGIREKLSIHLNAQKAYACLMESDNPDDPFHKTLDNLFL
jgi:pimeloyl-ACP methyl ester carboxylesterase